MGSRRSDRLRGSRYSRTGLGSSRTKRARLFRPGPTLKGVVGPAKTAEFRHYSDWPDRSDLFFEDTGTDRVEACLAATPGHAMLGS